LRIELENHGQDEATIGRACRRFVVRKHLVRGPGRSPKRSKALRATARRFVVADPTALAVTGSRQARGPDGAQPEALFWREPKTRHSGRGSSGLFLGATDAYRRTGINDTRSFSGADTSTRRRRGTKAAFRYHVDRGPRGGRPEGCGLRLHRPRDRRAAGDGRAHVGWRGVREGRGRSGGGPPKKADDRSTPRVAPEGISAGQGCGSFARPAAGLVWSQQM